MPIKRAKSKEDRSVWNSSLFEMEFKKRKRKEAIRKAFKDIEFDVEVAINNIPKKKMLSQKDPAFWTMAIGYLSKDLISRVINHKGTTWDQSFFKACLDKHQNNNYIKRR